ncbi:carboxylesterase/lipase family protein [Pseudomonas rhodesiae]|uniref:carboxylesterase/lipase family protein n=1 Tax=Pseudomonas rhodesiae TaxID=76760 RepID=UPI000F45F7C6|nr:carboxylesterase family protein [Pseudomonas rhodesiae]ROM50793.1 hypothetical protein BK650_19295 [Pseudomonas rhodesiae]ROM61443.1 hypothetical protein BK651_23555 [Pseudomonas rhodesiae]
MPNIKKIISNVLVLLGVAWSINLLALTQDPVLVQVETNKGLVVGVKSENIIEFKGIPFAEPPVGQLRWMPPKDMSAWDKPLIADKFHDVCATNLSLGGFALTSKTEDCLYLNVFTPPKLHKVSAKLPVMVWIHGGGLGTGSGNDYDATRLVAKNVIVVTMNYRVGVFGFFSHPAINAEDHPNVNYGIMDQQAVLRWVHQNIDRFGGDPGNVTLFGQSAGGHSVLAQIVSPTANNLFQKAIVSSGSYSLIQPSVEESSALGEQIAVNVGCGALTGKEAAACLRGLPSDMLLEKLPTNFVSDQVTTDGSIIPLQFSDAFKEGRFNRVTIINGFNSNEGTFFAALSMLKTGRPINYQDYLIGLKVFLGANIGEKLFAVANPLRNSKDLGVEFASFFGRAKFICPTPIISSWLSKYVPVYEYEFADMTAPSFLPAISLSYKASHTSEIQYIFKGFHGASGKVSELNKDQLNLSSRMVDYWVNFSRTGNPNDQNTNTWVPFDSKDESTMLFSTIHSRMITNVSEKYECGPIASVLTP